MTDLVRIRPAKRDEAALLSALCVRSKAHWGYDAEFMRLSWRSLQVDPAAIEEGRVFVAVDERDRPLGVVSCAFLGEDVDLMHLFVEPDALGRGVGRALFATAVEWTRAQSRRTLLIAVRPQCGGLLPAIGRALTPDGCRPTRSRDECCRCSTMRWMWRRLGRAER